MEYKAIFLGDAKEIGRVFGNGRREMISSIISCFDGVLTDKSILKHKNELKAVEYIFSTWGMPNLSVDIIKEYLPSLKFIFYAAGSVKAFADPFLECGVRIVSAWAANAIPVAEMVFSQIVLANKGFFKCIEKGYNRKYLAEYPGNYGTCTGIIACGMIGGLVAEKLKTINTTVIINDPYISDERAEGLGVKRVGLEEIFEKCDVITNHLPDIEETVGVLNYNLFSKMKPHAVFINSGRGRQVNEDDLCKALKKESGRMAILDVTHPEPPHKKSPLLKMDNIILTPHIDGSTGNEVNRMADYMIDELKLVLSGNDPKWEINAELLKKMA